MAEDYSKMTLNEMIMMNEKDRTGDYVEAFISKLLEEAMEPYYQEHPEQRPKE